MAIDTKCDGCGARLRVDERHAGKRARCPQCGHVNDPPAIGAVADHRIGADDDDGSESWTMMDGHGKVYGPASRSELELWFRQGRIGEDYRIRRSTGPWQPATQLFSTLTGSGNRERTTSTLTDRQVIDAPVGRAESTAADTARLTRKRHRGGLVLSLGVIGLFCSCMPLAVISLVMGLTDLGQMRAGTMDPAGRTLTKIGIVLSAIRLGIVVVSILSKLQ